MRKSDFNPSTLTDEEIENLFISRIEYFKYLFEKISCETPKSIPQHYLLIGHRGMGKTTFLYRIAVELRKKPFSESFIPLSFPEEQRNVDKLSKFWFNCLNALLDAFDKEGLFDFAADLELEINSLTKNDFLKDNLVYDVFTKWTEKIKKRPVLLVDNLNIIFNKITVNEQHQFRAILMSNNAPIVFGASTVVIEQTVNYGAPFYDAFQIHTLKKISFEESVEVFRNLATIVGGRDFDQNIFQNIARLRTLYQLTGGTPRTISMLFPLINLGFHENIQKDLDLILDQVTPLYNARIDELSDQMQIILHAIAINWEPMSLEEIRNNTNLENAQLSPQLKRLYDIGWLEKNSEMDTKGIGYEISERFFNLWYLMRYSTRRKKEYLFRLSRFLVSYYGAELKTIAGNRLNEKNYDTNQVSLDLALAHSLGNEGLGQNLYDKAHKDLIGFGKVDPNVIKDFEIPSDIINLEISKLKATFLEKYNKGNYEDCYTLSKEMLNLDPLNSKINFNYGIILTELSKFKEAEKAYIKATELDEYYAQPWNGLGNLYQDHFQKYEEAEKAYIKATKLDKKYAHPWNGLGNLYQNYFQKFEEAERSYLKAIALDKHAFEPRYSLGNLYQIYLKKYEEAEKAYIKATKLDEKNAYPWNGLGNLYQDHFQKYEKAEIAYTKALDLEPNDMFAKYNLIFLLRDKLDRLEEAKSKFSEIISINEILDSHYLNAALFDYYEKNFGMAKENIELALSEIKETLPINTQDDWWRAAGVIIKLGFGTHYLSVLKEKGYDSILKPYYTAIGALLSKTPKMIINRVAMEVREPAMEIMEKIRKYMS